MQIISPEEFMAQLYEFITQRLPAGFKIDDDPKIAGFLIFSDPRNRIMNPTIQVHPDTFEVTCNWSSSQRTVTEATCKLALIQETVFLAAKIQVELDEYKRLVKIKR